MGQKRNDRPVMAASVWILLVTIAMLVLEMLPDALRIPFASGPNSYVISTYSYFNLSVAFGTADLSPNLTVGLTIAILLFCSVGLLKRRGIVPYRLPVFICSSLIFVFCFFPLIRYGADCLSFSTCAIAALSLLSIALQALIKFRFTPLKTKLDVKKRRGGHIIRIISFGVLLLQLTMLLLEILPSGVRIPSYSISGEKEFLTYPYYSLEPVAKSFDLFPLAIMGLTVVILILSAVGLIKQQGLALFQIPVFTCSVLVFLFSFMPLVEHGMEGLSIPNCCLTVVSFLSVGLQGFLELRVSSCESGSESAH